MFLFTKNNIKVALLFLGLFNAANAVELRTLVQFDFPADITIEKKVRDVKEERVWATDPVYIAGAEFIYAAEFSPIHYGFGFAFKSSQSNNSAQGTPATIPLWANFSFGAYNNQRPFWPYAIVRGGTLLPLTTNGNWWERPFNYFIEGGVGVIMSYSIGLEVNYNFSSMKKSYVDKKTNFRVSSGRFGIQLSLGFELSRDKTYKPNDKIDNSVQ